MSLRLNQIRSIFQSVKLQRIMLNTWLWLAPIIQCLSRRQSFLEMQSTPNAPFKWCSITLILKVFPSKLSFSSQKPTTQQYPRSFANFPFLTGQLNRSKPRLRRERRLKKSMRTSYPGDRQQCCVRSILPQPIVVQ